MKRFLMTTVATTLALMIGATLAQVGGPIISGLPYNPRPVPEPPVYTNPIRWGCAGDGVHDDSTCLNAAAAGAVANNVELVLPGLSFGICAQSFAPPDNAEIRGAVNGRTKIVTLANCTSGQALNQVLLLPNNAVTVNPVPVFGKITNVVFDGFGLSQYVIAGQISSKWSFPGVVARNAKASTVTTAATNGTTAPGSATLSFASTSAAALGDVVDDLTRPGVVPSGATVQSCSPNCSAATSITISANITAWDDGTGVANGDTIRFMTPTANVYLPSGYEYDFTNFNVENSNDTGHTLYTSQTTLPMAGIYIPGASDSNFAFAVVKNVMYGVLDPNGFGNVYVHSHVWGQGVGNPTGQPFDLRPQYGFALGSGDHLCCETDTDDPQIAGVYISSVAGVPGARVQDTVAQWTAMPGSSWGSAFGTLIGSGLQHSIIRGGRAFDILFKGFPQNVVYQRGTSHPSTIVSQNDGALYSTTAKRMIGNTAAGGIAAATTTFLGPGGQDAANGNFWIMPCTGAITGFNVGLTKSPGVTPGHTLTVQDGGAATSLTGVISGSSFGLGPLQPPANTQISNITANAGDAINIKEVSKTGAATTNIRYQVFTNCE